MEEVVRLDRAGPIDPFHRQRQWNETEMGCGNAALPNGTARRRRRAPERYYVGHRKSSRRVYVVGQTEFEPLAHLNHRSRAGFDWGEPTDGALELAFALLSHAATSDPPEPICRVFCDEVLAALPAEGFVLAHGQIALWLLMPLSEICRAQHRRYLALRRRWAGWIRHDLKGDSGRWG